MLGDYRERGHNRFDSLLHFKRVLISPSVRVIARVGLRARQLMIVPKLTWTFAPGSGPIRTLRLYALPWQLSSCQWEHLVPVPLERSK
jgi:hypothetical protein